jgi:hypothetical protein
LIAQLSILTIGASFQYSMEQDTHTRTLTLHQWPLALHYLRDTKVAHPQLGYRVPNHTAKVRNTGIRSYDRECQDWPRCGGEIEVQWPTTKWIQQGQMKETSFEEGREFTALPENVNVEESGGEADTTAWIVAIGRAVPLEEHGRQCCSKVDAHRFNTTADTSATTSDVIGRQVGESGFDIHEIIQCNCGVLFIDTLPHTQTIANVRQNFGQILCNVALHAYWRVRWTDESTIS